jgi:hypothetical protein
MITCRSTLFFATVLVGLGLAAGCTVAPSSANSDGGTTGDGGASDASAASSGSTCGEILECATKCPDPDEGDVCANACVAQGNAQGKALVEALVACANQSGCKDSACFRSKCEAPVSACLAQSSAAAQGEPGPASPSTTGSFPADLAGIWSQVGLTNGSSFEFEADGRTTQIYINESNYLCHSKITVAASGTTSVSGSTLAFYRKEGTQTTITCDGPAKASAMSPATLTYAMERGKLDGKDSLTLTMAGTTPLVLTRR